MRLRRLFVVGKSSNVVIRHLREFGLLARSQHHLGVSAAGHVAINAILRNRGADSCEFAACLWLVAFQAPRREQLPVAAFVVVWIVAGDARHALAPLEALAEFEASELVVAVDTPLEFVLRGIEPHEAAENLAGAVTK